MLRGQGKGGCAVTCWALAWGCKPLASQTALGTSLTDLVWALQQATPSINIHPLGLSHKWERGQISPRSLCCHTLTF